MPTSNEAEEHLRVIRSLMEKATIYRAVSAEAAAVGGVLAIGASFATGNWMTPSAVLPPDSAPGPAAFLTPWLAVLFLVSLVNVYFLRQAAERRGDRFISPGMRLALGALLPSFLVAGVMTLYFSAHGSSVVLVVPVWVTCYGVGLLGTSHFAPRSLVCLGWAFLLAGLAAFTPAFGSVYTVRPGAVPEPWCVAQMLMAGTFGLFHLIYAACTWPRKTSGGA